MPYSKIPPTDPPRGNRRNWVAELSLPTRLELYCHGLAEQGIATWGFLVWDVGENRMLIEHSASVKKDENTSALLVGYHALNQGLKWLIQQDYHRKRTVAYTDDALVFGQLTGKYPVKEKDIWPVLHEVQKAIGLSPLLTLRFIHLENNDRAVQLAIDAYVAAQESRRMERISPILRELRQIGPKLFLVGDRYRVDLEAGTCTCPDFIRVHSDRYPIRCKHLLAALNLSQSPPKD